MNYTINTNNNNSDNTNILADKLADNTIDNNFASKTNSIICNLGYKCKSLNTHRNKSIPKQIKIISDYILVKSIITIMKEMQASQKKKQEVVKVQEK